MLQIQNLSTVLKNRAETQLSGTPSQDTLRPGAELHGCLLKHQRHTTQQQVQQNADTNVQTTIHGIPDLRPVLPILRQQTAPVFRQMLHGTMFQA